MQRSNLTSDDTTAWEKWRRRIQWLSYFILGGVGSLVMAMLVYYSFLYTQYMVIRWDEVATDMHDQPLWNVVALLVLAGVALGLSRITKALAPKKRRIPEWVLLIISTLWILFWGFWWITSLDRVPEGDQAHIYGAASYFLEGRFFFLEHGMYCQLYPQQLGQIVLVELLFLLVGTYNYFAIEVICVLMAVGIHVLGYGILKKLKAGTLSLMLYCFLMMGCIPLVCYTSWVYGDLPSTFFCYLFALLALRLHEKFTWYDLTGMLISFVLAALTRKNSLILLVAFAILAFLDLILKKRWRIVVAFVLAFACSMLSYQVVNKVTELQSGYEIGEGLPANSWIGMGIKESWNGNGWYDDYAKQVAREYDCDFDATKRFFRIFIKDRLAEFKENPGYAFQFFKKKILSQWNEPLYQCIYFTKNFKAEEGPEPGSFLDRLYKTGDAYQRVLFLADRWQFVVFVGTLLYFLFYIRKEREPVQLLFAVTILGGFFFTILWEAKARYCLPYYLMMYILAVLGYERIPEIVKNWKDKRNKK